MKGEQQHVLNSSGQKLGNALGMLTLLVTRLMFLEAITNEGNKNGDRLELEVPDVEHSLQRWWLSLEDE